MAKNVNPYDQLIAACRPIAEAWDRAWNPGVSDLDAAQPIHLTLTKGELMLIRHLVPRV